MGASPRNFLPYSIEYGIIAQWRVFYNYLLGSRQDGILLRIPDYSFVNEEKVDHEEVCSVSYVFEFGTVLCGRLQQACSEC